MTAEFSVNDCLYILNVDVSITVWKVYEAVHSLSLYCVCLSCVIFFFFSTYVVCKRIYSVSQKKNVRVYFLNNSVKKLADFNNFWQTDC